MTTESEQKVTSINSNIFFDEFTFDKNEFFPSDGSKELADNVLWLDPLLFIIQIKERKKNEVKTEVEENKWYNQTILRDAKKQIKNSLNYLKNYNEIKIKNVHGQELDIAGINLDNVKKIIIYDPNSNLINDQNRSIKIYESSQSGLIHIFSIDDYKYIFSLLLTPSEVQEYLDFREKLFLYNKVWVTSHVEKYIIAHFINTNDVELINEDYIKSIDRIVADYARFDLSKFLKDFLKNIYIAEQRESTEYWGIMREIALLKRYELSQFKERLIKMLEEARSTIISPEFPLLPYRFVSVRTECGFVFIPLPADKSKYWQNALYNFTEIYKYKHKLKKCLGVVAFKTGNYIDINWIYYNTDWKFDPVLKQHVELDQESYEESKVLLLDRYKFDD